MIVLDPVKLSKTSDTGFVVPDILAPRVPCKDHDFNSMKPLVLATWKHGSQGQMPGKSSILVESQSVLESIQLADSGINLVYHSARAKDYLSTIQLQLTPDQNRVKKHLQGGFPDQPTYQSIPWFKTFPLAPCSRGTRRVPQARLR